MESDDLSNRVIGCSVGEMRVIDVVLDQGIHQPSTADALPVQVMGRPLRLPVQDG